MVGDSIAITADSGTVTMNDVIAGEEPTTGSVTLHVFTNNASGYNLMIKDTDTTTALATTPDNGKKIEAGIPEKNSNTWGFKASTESANVSAAASANYRGVLDTEVIVASGTAASADSGGVITLTFGVAVDTTIPTGTYTDEVLLTASTK